MAGWRSKPGASRTLARRLTAWKSTIVRRGGSQLRTETFAYAFNCTGPAPLDHAFEKSVLRSLLDASAVQPDHLGIGLAVDEDCSGRSAIVGHGAADQGPVLGNHRGPDIREQAAAVAEDIARELGK